MNREMAESYITEVFGAKVLLAESAHNTLDILEANKGTVDLVFTDYNMPNMNGFQMAQRIRALYPQMPIVNHTGEVKGALDAVKSQFKTLNVSVVTKPFQWDEISIELAQALQKPDAAMTVGKNISSGDVPQEIKKAKEAFIRRIGTIERKFAELDQWKSAIQEFLNSIYAWANLSDSMGSKNIKDFIGGQAAFFITHNPYPYLEFFQAIDNELPRKASDKAMMVGDGATDDGLLTPVLAAEKRKQLEAKADEFRRIGFSDVVVNNIEKGIITKEEHFNILRTISKIGEQGKLAKWPGPGVDDAKKLAMLDQIIQLDQGYAGGLKQYKANTKKLLKDSQAGKNPFEGFTPEVPEGTQLTEINDRYKQMEEEGLMAFNKTAGVLVAGGVGDRLGYKGIKVGIPFDLITMKSYLQHYIESMLALQEKSNSLNHEARKVPLVIMTSDDTHALTINLLEENKYFGADGLSINPTREDVMNNNIKQIVILKQGMVPAVVDNDGTFVLDEADPFKLQVKPHGHGDIHMLIKQVGLDELWLKQGRTYTFFFQDTNGVVFNAVLAGLANSIRSKFGLNFLTVPREAGEKTGAITRMKNMDGRDQTINVEYNELGPLLKATVNPAGDVADPKTGKSPYPANLNVFIVENQGYHQKLNETGGIFGEFINPKYADDAKTKFKSPARSETMMQDYAKALPGVLVGFTNFEKRDVFSPVKNDITGALGVVKNGNYPDSMATGESDYYATYRRRLALAGVHINVKGDSRVVHGIPFNDGAKVMYSPEFAGTIDEVKSKIKRGSISDRSVLLIEGKDIKLSDVKIDGTLIIRTAPGVELDINGLEVNNAGWQFEDLTPEQLTDVSIPQAIRMRGYRLEKKAQMVIDIEEPGEYTINEGYLVETRSGNLIRKIPVEGLKIDATMADKAVIAKTPEGGIDLNSKNMVMGINGETINIKFDAAMLSQFSRGDFSGVHPVILNITPIFNIRPLLGLKEEENEGRLAKA
ncbi:MAG: UTP--glucose-1-phosphate uridylyltransferase [Candidatus Omnitrophica bacterium]|nr:UTP--glucose-1-phosphate uridylyltransferase [Candidatus Omnitrophota bacterium]